MSALQAPLDGHLPRGVVPAQPSSVTASPLIALPRLLTLAEMSTDTAALVTALNRFGTRRPGAVLARVCLAILRTGRPICRLLGFCSHRWTGMGGWRLPSTPRSAPHASQQIGC